MLQVVIRIKQWVRVTSFSGAMEQEMHQGINTTFSDLGILRQVVLRIEQQAGVTLSTAAFFDEVGEWVGTFG